MLINMTKPDIQSTLLTFLKQQSFDQLYLAVSGGVDSMVLLHAAAQLDLAQPIKLLHINHQIHAEASQWAEYVSNTASQYRVGCRVLTVSLDPTLGIEEGARLARYQAFSSIVSEKDLLLTAHHFNDQKETFIFRSLRGTSITGLLGMKPINVIHNCRVGRPFLDIPKAAFLDYAQHHQLTWVEDPSNQDLTLSRNAIRKAMDYLSNMKGFHITQNHLEKQHAIVQYSCNKALQDILVSAHIIDIELLEQFPIALQEMVFHTWLTMQVGYVSHHQSLELFTSFMTGSKDRYPEANFDSVSILRYRNLITAQKLPNLLYGTVTSSAEWIDLGLSGKIHNPGQEIVHISPLSKHKGRYKKQLQALGIPSWLRVYIPMVNDQPILLIPQNSRMLLWHPPKQWLHWLESTKAINNDIE